MSSMDDDEQLAGKREELLERFRATLNKPMADRYFDEDDLLEIFDYAGDVGDDYLRMEALICGARFYPDSEELLTRRAIFYSQYSDAARQQFMRYSAPANPSGPEALIFDIMALRSDDSDADKKAQVLSDLLKSRDNLLDEEVIQLVEAAGDLGLYHWLKEEMPVLRKKADYLIGLLYEVGMTAENYRDFSYAAEVLEELTMLEPFNSYYWMLLARQYAELEDEEKALSALDYSLAINPESPHAQLLKARYLFALGHKADEVVPLAEGAIKASEGATDAVRFLAALYHKEGRDDEARKLITDILANPSMGKGLPLFGNADVPTSKETELIPDLLVYGQPSPAPWLDRFFEANEENSQFMWTSWASQLAEEGHDELAVEVIQCFERNSGVKTPSLLSVEVPFRHKHYGSALRAIIEYASDTGTAETDSPELMAIHFVSLIKSGQYDKAKALGEFVLKVCDAASYYSFAKKLEYVGLKSIISDALAKMEPGKDLDSEFADFNPL